jgi:methylenetetrahydrofolate--tRNA-(uracil-5-)-methyltransferase
MHLTGSDNLYFYDAIAPIVEFTSIDMNIAFRASRFNRNEDDEGDYINCALNKNEYDLFVHELAVAERISLQDFESEITSGVKAGHHAYFEGCLPIEVMAQRHPQSLAFGPLRPIGLRDPRTGQRPHAVVQLRQDNLAATLYNMVGFQTNLTFSEQQRVFRLIPGLEHATFARYGQMHRNTYLAAPLFLSPTLQFNSHPNLWVAGQLSGVEGYMGNIATGLLAGLNAGRFLKGQPQMVLPPETMTGALCYYISHADPKSFQPMKANLGILPALPEFIRDKRTKALMLAERANLSLQDYLAQFHA